MLIDRKIIEALIALLGELKCNEPAGHLTAGLIYSYLIMQIQINDEEQNANTGTDGDNQDTA